MTTYDFELWDCELCKERFAIRGHGLLDVDVQKYLDTLHLWIARTCPHPVDSLIPASRMHFNVPQRILTKEINMVKYGDMVEVQSTKTGEVKEVPSAEIKKLKKQEGVKTGETPEWKVVHAEDRGIRSNGPE
jgi:hypothetical protein